MKNATHKNLNQQGNEAMTTISNTFSHARNEIARALKFLGFRGIDAERIPSEIVVSHKGMPFAVINIVCDPTSLAIATEIHVSADEGGEAESVKLPTDDVFGCVVDMVVRMKAANERALRAKRERTGCAAKKPSAVTVFRLDFTLGSDVAVLSANIEGRDWTVASFEKCEALTKSAEKAIFLAQVFMTGRDVERPQMRSFGLQVFVDGTRVRCTIEGGGF